MPEDLDVQKAEAKPDTERARTLSGRQTAPSPQEPAGSKLPVKAVVIGLVCTALLGTGIYFLAPHAGKTEGGRSGKAKGPVAVTVAIAKTETVPIEIRTTGNILPYSVVNIVPQVGGQLSSVHFTQGQTVKKGDLLFQIDPRPYKASLDQALGNVAKDKANVTAARANTARDQATVSQLQATMKKDQASLDYAHIEAKRYRNLVQQGAISMEQADQTVTTDATASAQIEADKKQIENARAVVNSDKAMIETAIGTLEADQAVAENAKIQLDWCTIRAPIDGRTSSLLVYEGNVVAANNATALVTIAQVQPIYVQFTIPEEYLDAVRRCLANNTLRIRAMIEGQTADHVAGTASFLENTVNTTSGTALLRAEFANNHLRLYPGQFVDVSVTMPPNAPSVVVPISAIQTTQKGNAVYVVGADKKVQLVPVELARTTDDWAAISSGIDAGMTIVTDGQLQLTPGATAKIVTADGTASGGKHKHTHGGGQGGGGNPDESFNPAGAGADSSDGSSTFQSNSTVNPLPTGSGSNTGKGLHGFGADQSTAPTSNQPPPPMPSASPSAAPGNSSNAMPAPGAGSETGFRGLGVRKPSAGVGSGWHHGH
jgi:membrane fusion protein, multidrug efflux system